MSDLLPHAIDQLPPSGYDNVALIPLPTHRTYERVNAKLNEIRALCSGNGLELDPKVIAWFAAAAHFVFREYEDWSNGLKKQFNADLKLIVERLDGLYHHHGPAAVQAEIARMCANPRSSVNLLGVRPFAQHSLGAPKFSIRQRAVYGPRM